MKNDVGYLDWHQEVLGCTYFDPTLKISFCPQPDFQMLLLSTILGKLRFIFSLRKHLDIRKK